VLLLCSHELQSQAAALQQLNKQRNADGVVFNPKDSLSAKGILIELISHKCPLKFRVGFKYSRKIITKEFKVFLPVFVRDLFKRCHALINRCAGLWFGVP